jgi:mRNA interferase YafQ
LLEIKIEKSFKKDIARDKKSGKFSEKDFEALKTIIQALQSQEEINKKYKRHPLKGSMKDYESIHVKSDWLLIFKTDRHYLVSVFKL